MNSLYEHSNAASSQAPTLGSLLFEGSSGSLPVANTPSLSTSASMSDSRSEASSSSADFFDNKHRTPQRSISSASQGRKLSRFANPSRSATSLRSPGAVRHGSPLASSSLAPVQQWQMPGGEAHVYQQLSQSTGMETSSSSSSSAAGGAAPSARTRALPRRPLPAPPEGARAGCLVTASSHSMSHSQAMSPSTSALSSSDSSSRPLPAVSPIPIPSKDDPGLSYSSGESSSSSLQSDFSSSSPDAVQEKKMMPQMTRTSSAVRNGTRNNSSSKPSMFSRASFTRRTQANTTLHRKKTTRSASNTGKLVPEGQRKRTPVPMNFTGGFDDEGNALFADEFDVALCSPVMPKPNRI